MVILLKAAKNIRFVSLKILWHIKEKETSPPTFFIAKNNNIDFRHKMWNKPVCRVKTISEDLFKSRR